MKRAVGVVFAIVLLTGAAFTADIMSSRREADTKPAASRPVGALVSAEALSLPEPMSIVLFSLALLGSTTALRYRLNRRA